ncbi:glycosyltransferase family 39 protein [Candidatus Microgenomates bacterium]|nr:glycosyltransferase family 39 protein [Candidatus Microgenomates bacterium]
MIKRADIVTWIVLVTAFLATRLANLGLIPIFTDESIYLRWSQIMAFDASLRFLPLTDGKPPLFMWLTSGVMRLLPQMDALLTGRLVSVAAGLGSVIGIFFASYILFKNRKISYLAALFYLLSPFTFFYDRFGLADSLLAMFGIWTLGLAVLLVRTIRLDVAMILGLTVGFGLLTKTPALFFFFLLPLSLLVGKWHWKLIPLFAVVVVFAQAVFSILRLFPLFNMIDQKNHEFILTFPEFFRNPLQYFWGNLHSLVPWEISYLTIPVALLTLLAFKKYFRPSLLLATLFLGHLIYMAVFNKVIYPRFLLTFTPYLLILAAVGLSFFSQRKLVLVAFLVFLYPAFTIFKLTTDPISAPLLQADRDQYLDGWAAGYGVTEVRAYLSKESKLHDKITIGTEGTFGLMPFALEIYKKDYPNVDIKPYWPLPEKIPAGLDYFIVYQRSAPPAGWPLELISKYRQGKGESSLQLYKVL